MTTAGSSPPPPFGADLPPLPDIDFGNFGTVEIKPRSRIQTLVAGAMRRNWLQIPHVTHHDEADITALEAARQAHNQEHPDGKLTLVPYLVKAVVGALRAHPVFNSSLDRAGNQVFKHYFHIGVAVDTPNGLLVPVIPDCDRRDLTDISTRVAELTAKARGRGLPITDMQGGCFTISSLGGIGGTSFTPIVNAPEVGILGVTRADWKPRRGTSDSVDWRLMLPLDLSYDHRVINGADAARFLVTLAALLADPVALATVPSSDA